MTFYVTSSEKIADALTSALLESDEYARNELFAELRAFRTTYRRSYDGVKKQPFARRLIDAIEDAEKLTKELADELAAQEN